MLESLVDDPAVGLRWSACVVDAASAQPLARHERDRVLSTASIGKVLLLIELARRLRAGELDPTALVDRGNETVGDSGIWQAMDASSLTIADAATLIGAVSDNLATNVLLDAVGLDAVARTAAALGLRDTALLDRVRDVRGPEHPPALSYGSAAELALLAARLHRGEAIDPGVSADVVGWLALGTDLSMVAAAFGLDPLAHRDADRGVALWNKTGTDRSVRADVGVVRMAEGALAYAVLAEWSPAGPDGVRDDVLAAMRATGEGLRAHLESTMARGATVTDAPAP